MLSTLLSRFWVAVVKSLRYASPRFRARLARAAGSLMWSVLARRRRVALTNLRLCFPDKTEKEREAMARSTFVHLARAALDHGVLWAGSRQDIENLVKFEGVENITQNAHEPLIVISPHFVGLDAAGIGLNLHVRGCSLYQKQSNPVWDKAALEGRLRFSNPVLIAKTGGGQDLKQVLRAMREGLPFYYLPDMDHGAKNSIFVPFFGVPAATVPMASRLAQIMKARVVMCIAEMTDEGYVIHISKPWEDFPSSDVQADTRRITAELERWIEKFPDQYLWTHRRFKTRPEGESSVY